MTRSSLLSVLALAGCAGPSSQLLVTVDSDAPAGSFACARIVVSRTDGGTSRAIRTLETSVPFSFGVLPPDEDASRRVSVEVELLPTCAPSNWPTLRTGAITGFVSGRVVELDLDASDACGAGCLEGQTCGASACESLPTIDPTTLPSSPSGEPNGGSTPMVLSP